MHWIILALIAGGYFLLKGKPKVEALPPSVTPELITLDGKPDFIPGIIGPPPVLGQPKYPNGTILTYMGERYKIIGASKTQAGEWKYYLEAISREGTTTVMESQIGKTFRLEV